MKKPEIALGIDMGGTYTKLGFVDQSGKIIANSKFKTKAHESFNSFLKNLKEKAIGLLNDMKNEFEFVGIGIGAPNANSANGCMENPPNFSWGKKIPLAREVSQLFNNLPVFITNDANAAALGELKFGEGKGMKNFIMLTLGTGLGSGIIVNGHLLTGEHGLAGEIGHVNYKPDGRKCNCGLTGCLETYVSVTGVRRTVFRLLGERRDPSPLRMVAFDDMTGEIIAEAALSGDVIAKKAFQYTGKALGSKIADIAAYFDPEAVILGGGLTKAGEILLEPTLASMNENIFTAYKGKIKVLTAHNSSGEAILGAAALVFENVTRAEEFTV